MNEIKIFENAEFGDIRTLEIEGEPWFVANEIANILGYVNNSEAIIKHVDEEDRKVLTFKAYSKTIEVLWKGNDYSNKTLINESGVYSLIIASKLPNAKKFKHWVTNEVLPSIRKTGSYNLPKDYLSALKALVVAEEEKQKLAIENQVMKPKADYFDALVDRELLTNFRDTAKELGLHQKEFISWLFENKYVYRDKRNNIKPYSQYTNTLFEIKDYTANDRSHVGSQTLITPRGKAEFKMLIKKL